MEQDTHDGGCLCGEVRYRTTGPPSRTSACHCRYCQLRTGSALGISVYFPDEQVEIVSGALNDYSFETESGRIFTQRFCARCGSTVCWQTEALKDQTGIAGGSFDPPPFWFDLANEVFTRSKAPFLDVTAENHHETTIFYTPVKQDPPHQR